MQRNIMRWVSLLSLLVIAWCGSPALRAQTTAFTYQGRLSDSGTPANGTYDLRFIIYDGNGAPIAGPITNAMTSVTNGLISVTLDFGAGIFSSGGDRLLDLSVRTKGS